MGIGQRDGDLSRIDPFHRMFLPWRRKRGTGRYLVSFA
jgi:hypothetical protein